MCSDLPDVSPDEGSSGTRTWLGLIAFLVVCFAAEAIGGLVTRPSIGTWYAGLARPAWSPPNGVFAPVWFALFLLMAIAAWLVWLRRGLRGARLLFTLFGVQLALNVLWSVLFFGLHSPAAAFVEILVLWVAIGATVVSFWGARRLAGILLLPYWAWVTFAAALNLAFWRLNA